MVVIVAHSVAKEQRRAEVRYVQIVYGLCKRL
jgi:hypothetical protein